MTPYTVVLADDHVLFRQGLRKLVETVAGLQVTGEATDGLELLALLRRVRANLAIVDISMPRLRGIETMHEMRATRPDTNVLMLTMHREKEFAFQAISAGARGYLLKEDADKELFAAIHRIRSGGVYISPRLSDELTAEWAVRRRDQRPVAPSDSLTVREREILKLTAEGRTSKQIGVALGISYRTVEHHRANLTAKLGLHRAAALVTYAIARGYVAAPLTRTTA